MSVLLDANALIALLWPPHEHHDAMRHWFRHHAAKGWATTALTQGAFVRIVSQPAFAGRSIPINETAGLLLRNLAHPQHGLLPLDFGFDAVIDACSGGLLGHRQITDAWLLTAAIRHNAQLLTFDAGLPQLLADPTERSRHILVL